MLGVALVAVGAGLRIALALVNAESNDDHLSVIAVIAREDRLPRASELDQAYHPKLYHATVAFLWELGPWASESSMLRTAQLVSCAAGILTVLLVHAFLRRQQLSERTRLLALSLVGLNPKLIGISAQATNDSLVVLFGTLCLFLAWAFLRSGSTKTFALVAVATVLAALTKGSGLVLFVAVVAAFAAAAFAGPSPAPIPRRRLALMTGAFAVGFVVLFAAVGPYRDNYEDSGGRVLGINVPPDPFPPLVDGSRVRRPGTTSIVATYLTFRFVDLVRHPVLPGGDESYPEHRTSLWSQLYGRLGSAHFDQWPPSWQDSGLATRTVVRGALFLGLLPAALLVAGLVVAVRRAAATIRARSAAAGLPDRSALLFSIAFLAFVAFIIVYTLRYRDFASMKVEYLFPAALAAVHLFTLGAESVRRASLVVGVIAALVVVYAIDVGLLVWRLA
ncbi:MAG TPA: phospholipid carrier-dependent glycosyltransferase [Acidimicrobiales bacterium]|nr:phospholipid carrier-dependent glycosyltransferase [Acidimicrobiales bacterium]